jgi:hypothetical protein
MSNNVDIQKNIDTLRAQLGGLQAIGTKAGTDIYKNRSPLDADTHITNIATALATNYGVSDLRDIGVRDAIKPGYASGSDESYTYIPEETVPEYFNKKTDQVIPGYKFASEGRGDGYSEYNLQAIKQADGSSIVLPIQSYNKSGFGAFQEAIAPIMPILAVALIATGAGAAVGGSMLGAGASAAAEAVGSAALNLGMQSLAGNINNFSDVLKAVAPSAVTFGISEFADIANSANLAQQDLALQGLGPDVSPFVSKTDAGKLFESITGVSGKVADTLAGSIQGALGAVAGDQDVTLGALGGAFKGYTAKAPIGTGSAGAASIEEANPFKSSFEITPTTLTSAPENTNALSKALGVDLFTSEYQAPTVTTTPYSLEGQTNQAFSKEAFMPGKTTTTIPTFTTTTQEGMLGDVGSGVSNIMGNTTLGNVTDLGATNTYGGMLGEIGSGASNLTNNKLIGDVTTLDVTGVNKGLGGTLGLSNYTGDTLYDSRISMQGQGDKVTSGFAGGAEQAKTLSGSDIVKIGTAVVGLGAAGSALDSTNKTITTPTSSAKATYANAPIKGFRMQKMQNEGGLTTYIPYINQTSLLPVPTGYKSI